MSRSTDVTFECDRCGRRETRAADRNAASEGLPIGWGMLKVRHPGNNADYDLCNSCRSALDTFIAGGEVVTT